MTTITLQNATSRIQLKADRIEEMRKVITSLNQEGSLMYIDDHNRGDSVQSLTNDWVIVEYRDRLCPFPIDRMGACLNPLYYSNIDNKVHLSTMSIGPYFPNVEALDEAGLTYYTVQ